MGIITGNLSKGSVWREHLLIFVCVGSRDYQFDRLIKKIDELIGEKLITEEVFGQIGRSNYVPKNFEYKRFMNSDEFRKYQEKADIIISHGGTGALISSLKLGKKVIATPRLAKYKEHTDDHQLQVAGVLDEQGYLKMVVKMDNLCEAIKSYQEKDGVREYNRPSHVLEIINEFIKERS